MLMLTWNTQVQWQELELMMKREFECTKITEKWAQEKKYSACMIVKGIKNIGCLSSFLSEENSNQLTWFYKHVDFGKVSYFSES